MEIVGRNPLYQVRKIAGRRPQGLDDDPTSFRPDVDRIIDLDLRGLETVDGIRIEALSPHFLDDSTQVYPLCIDYGTLVSPPRGRPPLRPLGRAAAALAGDFDCPARRASSDAIQARVPNTPISSPGTVKSALSFGQYSAWPCPRISTSASAPSLARSMPCKARGG